MESIELSELEESWPTAVSVVSTSKIRMTIHATKFWVGRFRGIIDSEIGPHLHNVEIYIPYVCGCKKKLNEIREAVNAVNREINQKADYIGQCQDVADDLFRKNEDTRIDQVEAEARDQ